MLNVTEEFAGLLSYAIVKTVFPGVYFISKGVETRKKFANCLAGFIAIIEQPLRRTLQRLIFYSTISHEH